MIAANYNALEVVHHLLLRCTSGCLHDGACLLMAPITPTSVRRTGCSSAFTWFREFVKQRQLDVTELQAFISE